MGGAKRQVVLRQARLGLNVSERAAAKHGRRLRMFPDCLVLSANLSSKFHFVLIFKMIDTLFPKKDHLQHYFCQGVWWEEKIIHA